MQIRVLFADDHVMFRKSLKSVLEMDLSIKVVGEAGSGKQLLDQVKNIPFDVVLLDIGMPDIDGLQVARRLLAIEPERKIVVLSGLIDEIYVFSMLRMGVAGYVTKTDSIEEIIGAIKAVAGSEKKYLSPNIAKCVVEKATASSNKEKPGNADLTIREVQILKHIAEGDTSVEIAKKLNVSPATIEVHRRNVMRKLGLNNIAHLTRYAIRHGLIVP
jgi:DNA-binding NarL/FixJ family response regulator